MRILTNPVLFRAAVVLFCAVFAFLLGLLSIRMLKKSITDESDVSDEGATSLETLPLTLYNTVIQQLKQQKQELVVQSQAEQNRARTSETLSQAVLSNLSSGVLVFGANGLVKSSNPAAKSILGFGSATGMSVEDIFRGALVRGSQPVASSDSPEAAEVEPISVAQEVRTVLRENSERRQMQVDYDTPTDEKRFLEITISKVLGSDGGVLGVACLISDLSELDNIRRQEESQTAISVEMATRLRISLTTIAGYAQQLAKNQDPELAAQLAEDIAHEAAELDKNIGGFLTAKQAAKAVAGSAN